MPQIPKNLELGSGKGLKYFMDHDRKSVIIWHFLNIVN